MTWLDDITEALRGLGGTGTLAEIYDGVETHRRRDGLNRLTPTWRDTIRRTIQDHSSDSVGYKNGTDVFFQSGGSELECGAFVSMFGRRRLPSTSMGERRSLNVPHS